MGLWSCRPITWPSGSGSNGSIPDHYAIALSVRMLSWLVAIRMLSLIPFRLYEGPWRYTGIKF